MRSRRSRKYLISGIDFDMNNVDSIVGNIPNEDPCDKVMIKTSIDNISCRIADIRISSEGTQSWYNAKVNNHCSIIY